MACAGALCLSAGAAAALDELDFNISGVSEEVETSLENAALLSQLESEGRRDPNDVIGAALSDYRRLLVTLYEAGHYSATVSIRLDGREAAEIPLLQTPARVSRVLVTVDAGPKFVFGRAEIAPLADGTEVPEQFAPGERAEASAIRGAVDAGVSGWRSVGHAKAAVAGQDLVADHARQTLDASVQLAPGPRLRFGDLDIVRDSAVKDVRLRMIAGLPTGEVFNPDELDLAANRLRRTGAFSSVTLTEAETVNPDGTLDVALEVVDAKPRRFGFGAELSTLEGLTLSTFWLHRNIFDGAERLRFDARVAQIGGQAGGYEGGIDYSIGVRLERPAALGPDTTGFITAQAAREDEPDLLSDRLTFGIGVSRRFSDTVSGELGVNYTFLRTRDDLGEREFQYVSLPTKVTLDRRDDTLNPTEGVYVQLGTTPFLGLGDTQSGARFTADARAYYSLSDEGRFTLAGRLQLGSIVGPEVEDTPPDFLFFSGGGGTVRGQPYKSLNVETDDGTFGGRSFAGLTAEFRAGITDRFGLVAFADAGFIGEGSAGNGEWHSGAGLGVRYQTGIGPIRLDVAGPTGGSTGDGIQVYLGIGQAF